MRLNWLAYDYHPYDGYGRFGRHFVRALVKLGADVMPLVRPQLRMPGWMRERVGFDWDRLTIACLPPYMLLPCPGRMWGFSMTEGSDLPEGWAERINETVGRLIVPCRQNADAFRKGGVTVPVHVIPGGTSPDEFPVFSANGHSQDTYTFLAMGDRGGRKGWVEAWQAWWRLFHDDPHARLIVKSRAEPNTLIKTLSQVDNDPRITFWNENVDDARDIYAKADCIVMPSRSEGWGMPHREAAMMGKPVIVSRYAGLDDGHTDEWATCVIDTLHPEPVPKSYSTHIVGEWMRADGDELAEAMRWCYDNRDEAARRGRQASLWLRENQTWRHAAERLIDLIKEH